MMLFESNIRNTREVNNDNENFLNKKLEIDNLFSI